MVCSGGYATDLSLSESGLEEDRPRFFPVSAAELGLSSLPLFYGLGFGATFGSLLACFLPIINFPGPGYPGPGCPVASRVVRCGASEVTVFGIVGSRPSFVLELVTLLNSDLNPNTVFCHVKGRVGFAVFAST